MEKKPETKFFSFIGREKLGNNLLRARNSCRLTRDEVVEASKTGFSKSSLQAWEAGEREPKLENLYDLAKIYNATLWHLLGEKCSGHEVNTKDKTSDFVEIPAYDIEVSAGHGVFSGGAYKASKHLAFRERWAKARGLDVKHLAVLFTKGDSMVPTIPENAAIVIDMTRTQAMDGKVYVIRIDDRLYVKRTQWIPGGGLRLISDNKQYDTFDITKQDFVANNIEVIGQVIHAAYDLPD